MQISNEGTGGRKGQAPPTRPPRAGAGTNSKFQHPPPSTGKVASLVAAGHTNGKTTPLASVSQSASGGSSGQGLKNGGGGSSGARSADRGGLDAYIEDDESARYQEALKQMKLSKPPPRMPAAAHKSIQVLIAVLSMASLFENHPAMKKTAQYGKMEAMFFGDEKTPSYEQAFIDGANNEGTFARAWDTVNESISSEYPSVGGISKRQLEYGHPLHKMTLGDKGKRITGKQLHAKASKGVKNLKIMESVYRSLKINGAFPSGLNHEDGLKAVVRYLLNNNDGSDSDDETEEAPAQFDNCMDYNGRVERVALSHAPR